MKNKNVAGHLSAGITILIWGTTFISTKVLLEDFSAVEITFYRFLLGYLALLCVYPHRLRPSDRKHEGLFALAGLSGITLYYLFQNVALTFSTASNIGVAVSVAPFFTAIFSRLVSKGETLKPSFFAGFAAAISGIILMSFSGGTGFAFHPAGDILAVAAAAVWAVYSLIVSRINAYGYNPIAVTRRIFLYGLAFLLPVLFATGRGLRPERFAETGNLLNLLLLGLAASALCFVTWNFTVKVLGAVRTSVYIYAIPVIAVFASVLMLHEKITLVSGIGIALTLTGLLISEGRTLRPRKKIRE